MTTLNFTAPTGLISAKVEKKIITLCKKKIQSYPIQVRQLRNIIKEYGPKYGHPSAFSFLFEPDRGGLNLVVFVEWPNGRAIHSSVDCSDLIEGRFRPFINVL